MPVMEITDEQLVHRAMMNLASRDVDMTCARWVAVMETFGVGCTYAHMLCQSHGLDPDERLPGPKCDACISTEYPDDE